MELTLAITKQDLLRQSLAPETRRNYDRYFKQYLEWCIDTGRPSMPAAHLCDYVAHLFSQGKGEMVIESTIKAVSSASRIQGYGRPPGYDQARVMMSAIRRMRGGGTKRQARPITFEEVQAMSEIASPIERALLLVQFFGALRMSEVVAIRWGDVVFRREGMELTIRRSKTDQEGKGRLAGLPYAANPTLCAKQALLRWKRESLADGYPEEYVFPGGGTIKSPHMASRTWATMFKELARRAGLDMTNISTHSLRAGFATQALDAGVDPLAVCKQGGWKRVDTLKIYDRRSVWSGNAAQEIMKKALDIDKVAF